MMDATVKPRFIVLGNGFILAIGTDLCSAALSEPRIEAASSRPMRKIVPHAGCGAAQRCVAEGGHRVLIA
jgi:hypothetical protein